MTYNHDSPKQNQVTVMETGTGALSPDLYYSILHNLSLIHISMLEAFHEKILKHGNIEPSVAPHCAIVRKHRQ